jgi:hypothetical protein
MIRDSCINRNRYWKREQNAQIGTAPGTNFHLQDSNPYGQGKREFSLAFNPNLVISLYIFAVYNKISSSPPSFIQEGGPLQGINSMQVKLYCFICALMY